uniref:Odorant-binding protein 14 n=1 Tax=Chrysopa pallens TaxID=417485 RepID=A0A0G3ZC72_CHRPA|nr:odorant-binding protein 14 [Chrysopa pallens]
MKYFTIVILLISFGYFNPILGDDDMQDIPVPMCCGDATYTITKEYIEGARVCEKDLPAYDSEDKLSGLKLGACFGECLGNLEKVLDGKNLVKENYFAYIKRMITDKNYDVFSKTIESSYDGCMKQVTDEIKNYDTIKCDLTFLGMLLCTSNRVLTECPPDKAVKDDFCNRSLDASKSINSTLAAIMGN